MNVMLIDCGGRNIHIPRTKGKTESVEAHQPSKVFDPIDEIVASLDQAKSYAKQVAKIGLEELITYLSLFSVPLKHVVLKIEI